MKKTFRAVAVSVVMLTATIGVWGVKAATDPPAAEAWAPYYNANAREGTIYRLYQAFYLRAPEQDGFNYWYLKSALGWKTTRIADFFALSPEFKGRYGTPTNGQFTNMVYQNVMDRPADADGYAYWVGHLDKGLSRGSLMLLFSDSVEYRAKTVTGVAPGLRGGSNALALLDALSVATEDRTGYDRDLFKHWDDEDHDGCDTRCEVIAAERRSDGTWYSAWDNTIVPSASGIQIDHVVALAEAWDSGASGWDAARRDSFGDWQTNLIGVSSSSNQSKSAGDAADWAPPHARANCLYAEITVTTKYVWLLSIDSAEQQALRSMLTGCTAKSLSVPPVTAPPTTRPPVTTAPTSGCRTAGIYAAKNGVCVANYEKSNGDVNCTDLPAAAKPVRVPNPSNDPYRLDADGNGIGCQ